MMVITIIILSIRLLYWMNWFPALISKDTYIQIQQVLGNEPYSNHQPWLHTVFMKLFMHIGKTGFGTNQAGAAVVAFVSLVLSSAMIICVLKHYYDRLHAGIWWAAAIIYLLDPLHCVYSVTIWKDTLFAYALLTFCFLLLAMDNQIVKIGKPRHYMWLLYVVVSFSLCFLRTNGLYAWLFTVPFLIWHYRRQVKPWVISTMVCFALIVSYKYFILPQFQVTEPDTVEALSVPLQQIAYTVQNGGDFSEYDTSVINAIVDMEEMGRNYDPHISDPIKNLIRDKGHQEFITQNKVIFFRMYISVGVKNIGDYTVAFLNQSKGYWYQKMSNYLYFQEGVHRFATEIGIRRSPLLSVKISTLFDKLMDKYCDVWHRLWSLALNTYVVWILFVYSLLRKKNSCCFLPVIGVFLTLVIATPVNDEFRYAYGIYLALPLLIMNVFSMEATTTSSGGC